MNVRTNISRSIVINSLQQSMDPEKQQLAYFYCSISSGDQERVSADGILRCLTRQLATQSSTDMDPSLVRLYKSRKEHGLLEDTLSVSECTELIKNLCRSHRFTYILVDALDECSETSRPLVFEALRTIVSQSSSSIKLLVSSREIKDVAAEYQDSFNHYIRTGDNQKDIDAYVISSLNKAIKPRGLLNGRVSLNLRRTIISTLCGGAQGMSVYPKEPPIVLCRHLIISFHRFQWVTSSLQLICNHSTNLESEICQLLENLPRDLAKIYDEIYEPISQKATQSDRLCYRILCWLLCATQPLSISEMMAAVIDEEMGRSEIDPQTLVDVCKTLIVMDKETIVFRFAHASVKQWLATRREFEDHLNHATVAERCLTICLGKPAASQVLVHANLEMRTYAVLHWAYHCSMSKKGARSPSGSVDSHGRIRNRLYPLFNEFLSIETAAGSSAFQVTMKDSVHLLFARMEATYFRDQIISAQLQSSMWKSALAEEFGEVGDLAKLPKAILKQSIDPTFENPTTLFAACAWGFPELIKLRPYLQAHDFQTTNILNQSCLLIATIYNQTRVVEQMLRKRCDPNYGEGTLPIHIAADAGHVEIVAALLDTRVKPRTKLDERSADGNTPLIITILRGHHKVMEMLLKAQCNIDGVDKQGRTALHTAIILGDLSSFRIILANHANVNLRDLRGTSPVLMAARYGRTKMAQNLLTMNEVNVNSPNYDGISPLGSIIRTRNMLLLKLILRRPEIDLNEADGNLRTESWQLLKRSLRHNTSEYLAGVLPPLTLSAYLGWEEGVEYLCSVPGVFRPDSCSFPYHSHLYSHGRLVQIWGDGRSEEVTTAFLAQSNSSEDLSTQIKPLCTTVLAGPFSMLQACLSHREVKREVKVDSPNTSNKNGQTALWMAVSLDQLELVKSLLEIPEIDPNISDSIWGMSPLNLAVWTGNKAITAVLLGDRRTDVNSLDRVWGQSSIIHAARFGRSEILRSLLECPKLKIHMPDSRWIRTAISWACEEGHTENVLLLLQSTSCRPDLPDCVGMTPLLYAARNGHEKIVTSLLEYNRSLATDRDNEGRTAAWHAASENHVGVLWNLFMMGVLQPDLVDYEYCSPMAVAASNGHTHVLEMLVSQVPPASVILDRDTRGRTLLARAAAAGRDGVCMYLLKTFPSLLYICDDDCRSPLSLSAESGNNLVVGILLQAGDSARGEVISLCQLRDNTGRIPLSWAIEYGHTDVFDSLIAADPNCINLADYSNRTMLSWAVSGGHQKMLEHLFYKGYDASGWDVTDRLGNTPFHWAMKSGNLRPFIAFLSLMLKRVDVGKTLENPDQEEIFRSYRANLQSLSRKAAAEEDALLFTAIRHGRSKDVTEALLHRVAPFTDIDEHQQTPMDLAIQLDNSIAALTMVASGRMDERTLATLKAAKPQWLKGDRVLSILGSSYRPHGYFYFSESCRTRNITMRHPNDEG